MRYFVSPKRATAFFAAAGLLAASVLPTLTAGTAYAEQLTERKITLSSSKLSQAGVTYASSFKPTQVTPIKGFVVEICQNSPLLGDSCSTTNGVSAVPTTGTVTLSGGTGDTTLDVHASSTAAGRYVVTDADGVTGGDGFTPTGTTTAITFSFTATNPSGNLTTAGTPGTFYARIATYGSAAAASGSTTAAPGSYLDYGSVALSTTNSLTVSAIVQEVLQFCVGGTTNNDDTTSIAANCAASFTGSGTCGNTVNLGVLDAGAVNVSPSASGAPTNGNACNGAAMVRTNAANGVNIAYYAEQDSGTNKKGSLRVPGATCDAVASNTDRCIDSAGATQSAFVAGAEKYGMTIAGINCGSTSAYTCSFAGSSNKVSRNANYDGSAAATFGSSIATGYAWDETGVPTSIASSTGVVDDEALIMHFAGTPNVTTPTGSYTVKANLIATSTF